MGSVVYQLQLSVVVYQLQLSVVVLVFAGEDDLRAVISAVTSLAGRWKDLGIFLGVCAGDLDTILSANPHSPSDCLRDMLLQWLRQSYNVRTTFKFQPSSIN